MKVKRLLYIALSLVLSLSLLAGCSSAPAEESAPAADAAEESAAPAEEGGEEAASTDFAGDELSIFVSSGWMETYYDETIDRFEETYDVTVDLQVMAGEQYFDLLSTKLSTATMADVFWIQSNATAITQVIGDPEEYLIDFSGEEWQSVMPETRQVGCMVDGKLYGLHVWHNSPEYVFVYNKTMFDELGLTAPTNYEEFMTVLAAVAETGITYPWFMPGADSWQHQLPFFQIGPVYEEHTPGLYDSLNNNTATFADNEKMLEVLGQFKEISDLGYMGPDWIGTSSANMINEMADRNAAMTVANSGFIKQLQDETGTEDEFGLFLIPLGDNTHFPTNPVGPTMFGYKGTENEALVREWFHFVTTTESLQEILDNSVYTNLHVTDTDVVQNWIPEELAFMETIDPNKMAVSVMQTGTLYTNDYWMPFGADLIAYCQGDMEANQVLQNLDTFRAETAEVMGNPDWE